MPRRPLDRRRLTSREVRRCWKKPKRRAVAHAAPCEGLDLVRLHDRPDLQPVRRVRAWRDWLKEQGVTSGPLFRQLATGDRLTRRALSGGRQARSVGALRPRAAAQHGGRPESDGRSASSAAGGTAVLEWWVGRSRLVRPRSGGVNGWAGPAVGRGLRLCAMPWWVVGG